MLNFHYQVCANGKMDPCGLSIIAGAGERKHRPLRPVDAGEVAVDVVERVVHLPILFGSVLAALDFPY